MNRKTLINTVVFLIILLGVVVLLKGKQKPETLSEKMEAVVEQATDDAKDAAEDVTDAAEDVKEEVTEEIEKVKEEKSAE